MDMKQEIYKSSTLGNIPLSFTGRRLLQNLREAVSEAIDEAIMNTRNDNQEVPIKWEPVSLARGRLAQYMSQLERRLIQGKRTVNELYGKFGYQHTEDSRNNKASESAADMLKRLGTDGDAWARELYSRIESFDAPFDVDTLRAWFANAIEHAKIMEGERLRKAYEPTVDKVANNTAVVNLPPIPPGYELTMIGGVTTIAPIDKG